MALRAVAGALGPSNPQGAHLSRRSPSPILHRIPIPKPENDQIFLASSSELKQDRDALQSYFLRENKSCAAKGFEVERLGWETCLDAMSETRQQDEYNKKVKNCDIFLSLFETKAGKFTEEEFDVAYQAFIEKKKPLIYTYSLSQTSLDQ
jgi:internalin A